MKEREQRPSTEEKPAPQRAPYERPQVQSEPLFESAAAANANVKGLEVQCTS